jgi:hypothetical protein
MTKIIKWFFVFFSCTFFSVPVFSQATNTVEKAVSEGKITESKGIEVVDAPTWKLNFYGFVKTDYVYADSAILSYGRENLNAPNQAKRVVQRDDAQMRSNIQLGDTRLGFKAQFGNNLTGIIELDLIDFDKSNPNVNTRPRIRQAYAVYGITPQWDIFFGQKWDIFSPLNPDSYNTIHSSFYNGNAGWMREQIGTTFKVSQLLHISSAIGNASVNNTADPNVSNERNKLPTGSLQFKFNIDKDHTVYLSGITTNRTYSDLNNDPTGTFLTGGNRPLEYDGSPTAFYQTSEINKSTKIRRQASGLSISAEHKFIDGKLRIKWEGNWGRNLGDLNTLTLGNAQSWTAASRMTASPLGALTSAEITRWSNYLGTRNEIVSIEENSGWLFIGYKFLPTWELGLIAGANKIVNQKDLSPAFATPANATAPFRNYTLSQANTANGLWTPTQMGRVRESSSGGYHLTYFAQTGIKLFFQHEITQTFYVDPERNKGLMAYIQSVNLDTGTVTFRNANFSYLSSSAKATTHVFRIGAMYNF